MFSKTHIDKIANKYRFEFNVPACWFIPDTGYSRTPTGETALLSPKKFRQSHFSSEVRMRKELNEMFDYHINNIGNKIDRNVGKVNIHVTARFHNTMALNGLSWVLNVLANRVMQSKRLRFGKIRNVGKVVFSCDPVNSRIKTINIVIEEV